MRHYTLYKMAISDFRNFWLFTHRNQNFDFSKINAHKIENVEDIKTGMYIIELCANNRCTKFSQYLYFWLCNGPTTK